MRKLIALVFGAFALLPATALCAVDTDGMCQDAAGGVIAVCGDDPLLSSCARFEYVCEDVGGVFTSAPGSTEDVYCDNDNDLLPDCSVLFKAACAVAGGTYTPYDTTEESGECTWDEE